MLAILIFGALGGIAGAALARRFAVFALVPTGLGLLAMTLSWRSLSGQSYLKFCCCAGVEIIALSAAYLLRLGLTEHGDRLREVLESFSLVKTGKVGNRTFFQSSVSRRLR